LSYCHETLGGRVVKIPVRPPLAVREEVADFYLEHLGDLLDVVEVEGDFSSYAPGDVHRRFADGRRHVGTCLHLACQQRAHLFCYLLAEQALGRTSISHALSV